jgi:hypothetical protein
MKSAARSSRTTGSSGCSTERLRAARSASSAALAFALRLLSASAGAVDPTPPSRPTKSANYYRAGSDMVDRLPLALILGSTWTAMVAAESIAVVLAAKGGLRLGVGRELPIGLGPPGGSASLSHARCLRGLWRRRWHLRVPPSAPAPAERVVRDRRRMVRAACAERRSPHRRRVVVGSHALSAVWDFSARPARALVLASAIVAGCCGSTYLCALEPSPDS